MSAPQPRIPARRTELRNARSSRRGSRAASVLSAAMLLAALAILGMVARTVAAGPPASIRPVEGWEALLDPSRTTGPANAPVRIVEFSDFQCPFCARAQTALAALEERYPGRIAVVYRHLPLTEVHAFASTAALASECARDQGRFRPFHDELFRQQARIGQVPWSRFAAQAGVPDTAAFGECVRLRRHRERVEEDVRHARRLGVDGTPVFIVEGMRVDGSPAGATVDSLIQARLRAAAPARHPSGTAASSAARPSAPGNPHERTSP